MHEEKFWLLLSVKLSGEATPEELEDFDEIIKHHPELSWQAQLMLQMWPPEPEASSTEDFFNRHLQRLSNQPDMQIIPPREDIQNPEIPGEDHEKHKPLRWLLLLSGVAAMVIVFFFYYNNRSPVNANAKQQVASNTVTTRKGSKSNIQLPDGSMVWLNADSKLTYDENFGGNFREIHLEGEGYFEVMRDENRPFIIHTKTIDIRVLGTIFNVKAYDAEASTETSLIKGSVEVTLHNSPEKKIILKPNEKLRVNNKNFEYTTSADAEKLKAAEDMNIVVGKIHYQKKDSMALDALWIRNKLVFDAESLEEVMRKIERWYNVKVEINVDDNMKSTQYSAIFDNENLSQVMEALKITGSFSYSVNKDIVTIK
ncbi:MAG: FecR family protein [Terrimonas sp.]|nr:FecR family protein [Terrimonas sp.]OJY93316.1 MAG: hypothetical protein BGP13_16955 [Sphingobacteriales bacterium 40-81]